MGFKLIAEQVSIKTSVPASLWVSSDSRARYMRDHARNTGETRAKHARNTRETRAKYARNTRNRLSLFRALDHQLLTKDLYLPDAIFTGQPSPARQRRASCRRRLCVSRHSSTQAQVLGQRG